MVALNAVGRAHDVAVMTDFRSMSKNKSGTAAAATLVAMSLRLCSTSIAPISPPPCCYSLVDGRPRYDGFDGPRCGPELRAEEDYEAEQHRKAHGFGNSGVPLTLSPAERYLREVRGIHCPLPATLGFLAPTRAGHHPALIAAYGLPMSSSRVFWPNPKCRCCTFGAAEVRTAAAKPTVKPNKVTVGSPAGQPIVLAPLNDLLGLAITEGIEDALSLHAASGLGAWAAGGASHMRALAAAVPDHVDWFRIVADGDETGHQQRIRIVLLIDRPWTSRRGHRPIALGYSDAANKTSLLRNQSRAFHNAGL